MKNKRTFLREVKLVIYHIVKDFDVDEVKILGWKKCLEGLFPDKLFREIRKDFVDQGVFVSKSSWSEVGQLIFILTWFWFSIFLFFLKRQLKNDLIDFE